MKRIRCAIYTRKSSEEGLEQGFNSLDAQREACAAYILSQAGEGWQRVPALYDDGGFSGGTLERPGLQRLIADVAAGQIDIIVVYKVDRLTRSLFDFAKLVDRFEQAGTSFVSVTQSFNTTNSMGRLTLNMLLSFAQFEREVTAERIRDKLAASKAKGMWMGGTPPIGYRPDGRTLAIADEEAALVRNIYRRYLEAGTVRKVADELTRAGIRTPVRYTKAGRQTGGCAFSRGQLCHILKNPVYAGDIRHRSAIHPGQHPAIIARTIWDEVQRRLVAHVQGERTTTRPDSSILAGRIVDEHGDPLIVTHSVKNKVRHRYYVSRALHHGTSRNGLRIPAREIEPLVVEEMAKLFDDPVGLIDRLGTQADPVRLTAAYARAAEVAANLRTRSRCGVADLLSQVRVLPDRVDVDVRAASIAGCLGTEELGEGSTPLTVSITARLSRAGKVVRLVLKDGRAVSPSDGDVAMARLFAQARSWWSVLAEGRLTVEQLALREGVASSWITRVVRTAFLAPDIVEHALDGRLRAGIGVSTLKRTEAIAMRWEDQRRACLPG